MGRRGKRAARGGAAGRGGDSLDSERDQAVSLLAECFAVDRITMEEFERRADLVHAARSRTELVAAIDGLSRRPAPAPVARGPSAMPTAPPPPVGVEAVGGPHAHAHQERAIAVLGETRREGTWAPGQRVQAIAVLGSTVLDFREVALPPGRTVVSALTMMGSVEVIVPPHCHVECAGSAVLGSFEQRREYLPHQAGPDGPVIRIEGVAILGSVEVEYRRLDESRRAARRRRKLEKKELRRLQRGKRRK